MTPQDFEKRWLAIHDDISGEPRLLADILPGVMEDIRRRREKYLYSERQKRKREQSILAENNY